MRFVLLTILVLAALTLVGCHDDEQNCVSSPKSADCRSNMDRVLGL